MLGPTKWRLLTIVAGILLAHAIDSPVKTTIHQKQNGQIQSFTNQNLGLTIEKLEPWTTSRSSRNLLMPHEQFSNIDNIRYIDMRSQNSKNLQNTFGSFRYNANAPATAATTPYQNRRSDEVDESEDQRNSRGLTAAEEFHSDRINIQNGSFVPSSNATLNSLGANRYHYKVIPINYYTTSDESAEKEAFTGQTESQKETEDDGETDDNNDKMDAGTDVEPARRSGIQFPPTPLQYSNNFVPQSYSEESLNFGEAVGALQRPYNDDTAPEYDGRYTRGISFESEDQADYGRSAYAGRYFRDFPVRQPFAENLEMRPSENRPTRIEFPGNKPNVPIRDDVTKFGDVNGPVTAVQRLNEFQDKQNYRPYENVGGAGITGGVNGGGYYSDNFSPPRSYFPAKVFTEYNDYAAVLPAQPPLSSKYYKSPFYKSRSPRVVFPPNDTPTGPSSLYSNENVVFRYLLQPLSFIPCVELLSPSHIHRDQNFGLNDLSAIQDIRNEFNPEDTAGGDEVTPSNANSNGNNNDRGNKF